MSATERGLVRAIGPIGLAAGIVNITVGGGIFRLPATVAASLGAAAWFAYVICAVAFASILISLADAGRRVTATGGPYAYVGVALGPLAGFLCGVMLWLLSTFAFAAVSMVLAGSIGSLVPQLASPLSRGTALAAVFIVIAGVNIRGVQHGTWLINVVTVAKLLPLVLLVLAGLLAGRASNLAIERLPSVSELARTSLVLVFAFAGVESALVPSGEVRNPADTVPRAIVLALLITTALYIGLQLSTQGILGSALAAHQDTPLADAAGAAFGPIARLIILVGTVVALLGYVGGMMLAVPRSLFALARDGFLPAPLRLVHSHFHTPWVAIAAQAVIVLLLALTSSFERLAVLATLSVLLVYAACCLAAWALRRRQGASGGSGLFEHAARLAPFVALALIGWMLTGIHLAEWSAVAGCLAGATVLYLATMRHRSTLLA